MHNTTLCPAAPTSIGPDKNVDPESFACFLLLGISSCVLFFFEFGCSREILKEFGFVVFLIFL